MKRRSFLLRRGQSLTEFALVIPMLFLLLVFIFDLGRVTYYYTVMNNAVREATRYGSVSPGGNISQVAADSLYGMSGSAVTIGVSYVDAGEAVQVAMSYNFQPATPLLGTMLGGDGTILLSTQAAMAIEQ